MYDTRTSVWLLLNDYSDHEAMFSTLSIAPLVCPGDEVGLLAFAGESVQQLVLAIELGCAPGTYSPNFTYVPCYECETGKHIV